MAAKKSSSKKGFVLPSFLTTHLFEVVWNGAFGSLLGALSGLVVTLLIYGLDQVANSVFSFYYGGFTYGGPDLLMGMMLGGFLGAIFGSIFGLREVK
jgi:hypothetical protein